MRDFRQLKVWDSARELTKQIYAATAQFPSAERFGLTSQLRRAAVSVAANIAEGCGRSGNAELGRFLIVAMGSASEVECELQLAADLAMLSPATHAALDRAVTELKRMLATLIARVNAARG